MAGRIGTIYCDLFQREGNVRKYENAAHFTIRCSRRTDDDEPMSNDEKLVNIQSERTVTANGKSQTYQLPIVVLVTNFMRPSGDQPSLLTLSDIDTLFHEMGHAMHCILILH
jgi:mitochondrial intermediate peptidase